MKHLPVFGNHQPHDLLQAHLSGPFETWNQQGRTDPPALLIQCLKGARQMGLKQVMGLVLAENRQMLQLGRKTGFGVKRVQNTGEYELSIDLAGTRVE